LLNEINTAKADMEVAYALGTEAGNAEAIRLSEQVIQVKAAEIAVILNNLGTIYEVNGTIYNGTSSVIVSAVDAACTQTAASYSCRVQANGSIITINAIDSAGSNEATSCSITGVSAVNTTLVGCTIEFPLIMSISNYSACTATDAAPTPTPCSVKKRQDFDIQFFINNNDSIFSVSINNDTPADAAIVGVPSLVSATWEQTITSSTSTSETFDVTIEATMGAETISKKMYFISANN